MSDAERLSRENFVEVCRANSELEGNLLVSYLAENGIEAVLQEPPSVPPLDMAESLTGMDRVHGVFVLEHNSKKATSLVQEFLSAPLDESRLEQEGSTGQRADGEASDERVSGEKNT